MPMTPPARERVVVLIDDDDSVRRALARRLRAAGHVVEAFATPVAFLERTEELDVGAIITDLQMPGMTGLELQGALQSAGSEVPIIFISAHGDVDTGVAAMRAGAVHFLSKPFADTALLATLDEALTLAVDRAEARRTRLAAARAYAALTAREKDVFWLVTDGLMNKVVAERLGIAEKTVKIHRARVMEKMHAPRLADLVRIAQALDRGERPARAAPTSRPPR